MIVDPFDPKQGITPSGMPAAQMYFLRPGASPLGDLSDATFVGLTDVGECAKSDPNCSQNPADE